MGIIKRVRSIFPIPKDWEKDDDRKSFAIRIEQAFRELFTKSVFGLRIGTNGSVRTPGTDNVITLGNASTRTVANNLTTTLSGSVLDARQGKVLADKWYTTISANTNLNDVTTPGIYACANSTTAATLSNCPFNDIGFTMLVTQKSTSLQIQLIMTGDGMYSRRRTTTGWGAWRKYTSTAV